MKKIINFLLAVLVLSGFNAVNAQDKLVVNRTGESMVKISLNAFSFAKPLSDYAKNRKGSQQPMSLFQFMDWSAENGFDAVDLTGYYFPGYPEVPSDDFIFSIKKHAFLNGLDISGTGVSNNFADPNPENRARDVERVKSWILVAQKLGAPVIRVFSGPIPEGYENKRSEVSSWIVDCLKECAEFAEKNGVLIGVQNHGDFLKTADETIELIKKVNSKWVGIIVDTGYFQTEDPYVDIAKAMPYAVSFQLKESVFGAASTKKIDLIKIMNIVKESGYRGYLPIETLSPLGGNKARKAQEQAALAAKSSGGKSGGSGKGGKKSGGISNSTKTGGKKSVSEPVSSSRTNSEQTLSARPEYDPYTVVPEFMKKVKSAQKEVFGDK